MKTRAVSLLVGVALALPVRASFADDAEEEIPPRFEVVDFASIPTGALPPLPTEGSAPKDLPAARVADLKIENVDTRTSPRAKKPRIRKKGKSARTVGSRMVEIKPAAPSLELLYVPAGGVGEIDGESAVRLSCEKGAAPSLLRREKLTFDREGRARLQIDDLWFDPESCSVRSGSSSVVPLGAIARDKGQPWLFAVRNDTSVTFVMPRPNQLSAETMAGEPLAIRGPYGRVTLPLGRWGSGSIFGELSSLALEVPGPANAGASVAPTSSDGDQGPTELMVEMVQTMSEKQPTLLVRTREPRAVSASLEGRD